jgi:hypothetical protein
MDKGKLTKDRQYHGQKEAEKRQSISWPMWNWQKTDNIMAKVKLTKDIQYHGQTWYCLSFVSFPLSMILSVFCQFSFGHVIVFLLSVFLWPCYCLSFFGFHLAMIMSVFWQRQTISWPKGNWQKPDNIMTKGKLTKDRQYNGQRETEKTDNIMDSLCPWYCLSFVSFPLGMLLSVFCQFSFGHVIVCLFSFSFWPW